MSNRLEDEVQPRKASLDEQQNGQEKEIPVASEQELEPEETIHIHYFPDAIVILTEEEKSQVVDSTPVIPQNVSFLPAYIAMLVYLFLILSTLAFQVYVAFNPPSATVYILTTQTPVTVQTILTLPTKRLPPFTFTKTQTVKTTGHGHQPATQAHGYLTFYNAFTQPQTIAVGTLLVGADGEQVVTNETVYLPAGNLSTNGQATVSAHAVNYGTEGNIRAGDIFGACCRALIQVENSAFTGGQDERDYQAVAKTDIFSVVTSLSSQFQQTLQETVLSQVSHNETIISSIPCTTAVQSNHLIGEEAALVTLTLHKACTPLSYSTDTFQQQAGNALSFAAQNQFGTGYALFGAISTNITKTTIRPNTILLSVTCNGSWARQFNTRHLATLIAGKSTDEAKAQLKQSQGIQNTSIQLEGFTDRIPKNPQLIHFVFLYETV